MVFAKDKTVHNMNFNRLKAYRRRVIAHTLTHCYVCCTKCDPVHYERVSDWESDFIQDIIKHRTFVEMVYRKLKKVHDNANN